MKQNSRRFMSALLALVLLISISPAVFAAEAAPAPAETPEAVVTPVATESEEVSQVTEPQATEPQATEPQATEPQATEPQATEPQATEPQATEPQATEPQATEPQAAEPQAAAAVIEQVELTLPDEVKNATTAVTMDLPVPATAAYTAKVSWKNGTEPVAADTALEVGTTYTREITVTAKEGSVFKEGAPALGYVKVDGKDVSFSMNATAAATVMTIVTDITPAPDAAAKIVREGKDVYFDTFDLAFKDAKEGEEIIVLKSCDTEAGINLNKNITVTGAEGVQPTLNFTKYGMALWAKKIVFNNLDITMIKVGSTPYYQEWSWMTICGQAGSEIVLNNVNMLLDAQGLNKHAIFADNGMRLAMNNSHLKICNYGQDALEWNDGRYKYHVDMVNSSYVADHNRSGFTGTFNVHTQNSLVNVINSTGNGSNGSNFYFTDSVVNFNDNGSHGLSATVLESTRTPITADRNGLYGIVARYTKFIDCTGEDRIQGNDNGWNGLRIGLSDTANHKLTVENSQLTFLNNGYKKPTDTWSGVVLRHVIGGTMDANSSLTIRGSANNGLRMFAGSDFTIAEGAQVDITVNNSDLKGGNGQGGGVRMMNNSKLVLPTTAKVYNNHADKEGDDFYVTTGSSVTFGPTGAGWALDGTPNTVDCLKAIDGWYDDTANVEGQPKTRWNAHSVEDLHVLKVEQPYGVKNGPYALKAAHDILRDEVQEEASVTFVKVDGNNKTKALAGAEFTLYSSADCNATDAVATYTTDENGVLTVSQMPGTYYLKETAAPAGYQLSNAVYTITVTAGEPVTEQKLVEGEVMELTTISASAAVENMIPNTSGHYQLVNFPLRDVTITKVWKDNGDETYRPGSVDVLLNANGEYCKTVTLSKDNNWTVTVENLPSVDENGREIDYTVEELTQLPQYSVSYLPTDTGYQVVNTLNPDAFMSIDVVKEWDDNGVDYRTAEIQVALVINGQVSDKVITLSDENNWHGSFENLPKQDMEGFDYAYSVKELTKLPHYTNTVESNEQGTEFIITNSLNPDMFTSVTVEKVWNDNGDETYRVDTIKVNLLANGVPCKELELTKAENWKVTVDNLPVVDMDGNTITYTAEEVTDLPHYIESADGLTVTNTLDESVFHDITVKKVWDDNGLTTYRTNIIEVALMAGTEEIDTAELYATNNWTAVFAHLPDVDMNGNIIEYSVVEKTQLHHYKSEITGNDMHTEFIITNTLDPDCFTSIVLEKVWNDNGETAYRTDSVKVALLANGKQIEEYVLSEANGWKQTVNNLPKVDMDGNPIDYTVEELTKLPHYTVSYNGATVVNSLNPDAFTDVSVVKEWNDRNELYRTDSIRVGLVVNGQLTDAELTLSAENNWHGSFENLPKVDMDGQEIHYSVKELTQLHHYNSEVTVDESGYSFVIENVLDPEQFMDLTVNKVWEDKNELYRSQNIVVRLLANGEARGELILNEKNGWSQTVTNLPKVDMDGNPIEYTVKEVTKLPHYLTEIVESDVGYTIVNRLNPEMFTSLTVNKVWEDNNELYRSESIKIALLANGQPVGQLVLNKQNGWSQTATDLPLVDANGNPITYTVEELTQLMHYNTSIEKTEVGFTVVNTLNPDAFKDITVKKLWADGDNTAYRPDFIEVEWLRNGKAAGKLVLNEKNNWQAVVKNQPIVDENGKEIEYTVKELTKLPHYTTTVEGFTIVNTLNPDCFTDIVLEKVWADEGVTTYRTESVKVALLANGEQIEEYVLSEANGWKQLVENLPLVDMDGKEIKYSVKELTQLPHYQVSYDGFKVINTLDSKQFTDITVEKVWKDRGNEDFRPTSVEVALLANGQELKVLTLNAKNDWHKTVKDLPKVDAEGKEIVYSVNELTKLPHYTASVEGTTVTNTLNPEAFRSIVIEKVWSDELTDQFRTESVKIALLANGEQIGEYELNADNEWKVEIKDLPKVDAEGKEIVYSVNELTKLPYYQVSYEETELGFIVTNTLDLNAFREITVNKVWEDNNDTKYRPDSIKVGFFANDKQIAELELRAENNWSITVKVPVNDREGNPIRYSVKELTELKQYNVSYRDDFTIVNTLIVDNHRDITIEKIWKDNNIVSGRSQSVEVALYANGKEIGKYTLNDANNWKITVRVDALDENGNKINYTVKELTQLKDYVTQYTNGGFTIVNTLRSLLPDTPKTGDESNIGLYLGLTIASAACIGGVIFLGKKKKHEEE